MSTLRKMVEAGGRASTGDRGADYALRCSVRHECGTILCVETNKPRVWAALGKCSMSKRGLLPAKTAERGGHNGGEDPALGSEYFLRAESFSAGLRWRDSCAGVVLVRHAGTIYSDGSLILCKSVVGEGRWNLGALESRRRKPNSAERRYSGPSGRRTAS